ADPWLAAKQYQRAWHDTAAENAIKLSDARRHPRRLHDLDFGVQARDAGAAGERVTMNVRSRGGQPVFRAFFDKGVPGTAIAAPSQPLRRLRATFLADENDLGRLGHQGSYTLSMRVPIRHRISYGIVPMLAAISRASM